MTAQEYARRVQKAGPHSPLLADCLWAFCVGGGICLLGEGLRQLFLRQGADTEAAGTLTSCTLILLSAVLTTLGWYQKLAAKAGAGSLVPITGFANAVVSQAIEARCEGYVTGVGAKMFQIAGPVIVYGVLASTAALAIIPMADWLEEPAAARMNTPGQAQGNWQWRADAKKLTPALAAEIRVLTERYFRAAK